METDYLKLVADLQARASAAVASFHGVRISLYKTLAAACLLHRQIMKVQPELLADAYAAARIGFVYRDDQMSLYRPFLRLIYKIDNAKGYMNNKVGDYAAALCEMEKQVDSNPDFYELEGEARLAQFIENAGGIHALARKHRGEPIPVNDDADVGTCTDQDNGSGDDQDEDSSKDHDDDGDDKPDPVEFKKRAEEASQILSGDTIVGIGTLTPVRPVNVAESGLVVLVGKMRADGLIEIVGATNAKKVLDQAVVAAVVNQSASVPADLALIAEVVCVKKYPDHAMPPVGQKREDWLDKRFFDKVVAKTANDNAAISDPLTPPRKLVIDDASGTVQYTNVGYDRGVVVSCRPTTKLVITGKNLVMRHDQCMQVEGVIDNGLEYLRSQCANTNGPLTPQVIETVDLLTNKTHAFRLEEAAIVDGEEEGHSHFNFDGFRSSWSTLIDRVWIEGLRKVFVTDYFQTLGAKNQISRENNRIWRIKVSSDAITFGYNIDATGNAATDQFATAVRFAADVSNFLCLVRAKDIGPILYRVADMDLRGQVTLAGNDQAIVLQFSTSKGEYSIAIPTIVANNNAPIAPSLFCKKVY